MQIIPLHLDKEIDTSDDVSEIILNLSEISDGDILVIAQKIISKQEGRIVNLDTVSPSLLASGIGSQYQKDPRIIELILSETKRIVRMKNGIIIVRTNDDFICANAGVDESNVKNGFATLLPLNSDESAYRIRKKIYEKTKKNVGVIITDTFGRPFRMGQTNCAIGVSGLLPILDYAGMKDSFGKIMRVSAIAVADEISSAAELVMGKVSKCPIAIVRGYSFNESDNSSKELIRPENEDLFR
ncbi:MAG: coenzyme F420-0:L-glutamate ligase [Nitrosopumilus sp.]|uniref:coenzyme F420-0:L-glutamate ligase n=1 Tax=Nitrosopumilus sp. TaxID=2024843 RepID=UPI00247D0F6C|nr:coenzyme F420-0:L-glutamate ligase [Nitrosopumilus sp.]MCV0391922.1 coenzyme F420-0:L-glutamate ligase [Nitrosopumilus sp.]